MKNQIRYTSSLTINKQTTYDFTTLLVLGNKNKDATLNKLYDLYKSRDADIIRIICHNSDDIVQPLVDLQKEMMTRFRKMESEQVNSAFKLKDGIRLKCVMIDNLDNVMGDDNSINVDLCRQAIGSVARLAKATGLVLILGCSNGNKCINTDLLNNIHNIIITDALDANFSNRFFGEDFSNTVIPKNKILFYNANIFYSNNKQFLKCKINDIC